MRVFTASLATETNTFAPLPTGLARSAIETSHPAGTHPAAPDPVCRPAVGGPPARPRELGWTVIEGLVAFAQPGGITTRAAWETLRDELLADLRAALPVHMVLLGLHGAMVADGCDDCEGALLARCAQHRRPGVVVGAELDPHHHLSGGDAAACRPADQLQGVPAHRRAGARLRAGRPVRRQVAGRMRPVIGVVDCEMISIVHTTREPARGFVDRLQALEGRDGVLSISVTHGFPWGDVADMGTKVLVYTDADPGAEAHRPWRGAGRRADRPARALHTPQPGIDAALDQALALAPPGRW
jgi:microcystin degradation protein MlrC